MKGEDAALEAAPPAMGEGQAAKEAMPAAAASAISATRSASLQPAAWGEERMMAAAAWLAAR